MDRTQPINADVVDGTYFRGSGRLIINGSGGSGTNKVQETAAAGICIGVTAGESSRDAAGALEAANATVSYYPLGGVLLVQVDAASTFNIGATVYVGANGLATSTVGSNKKLGIYVGDGAHTATALSAPLGGNTDSTGATEGALIRVATHGAAIA
ncbi:MAG: hypothetical protein Unbinned2404contig1000_16 [Prokaryotic dsDNA virus sp.]|nr:MAG: hypothetical protein Unbinned2404contig1000_16 [Prokaryotic dsDNA virus sp.]|tara:strand:- start:1573 stop:2037 length:465 start_codon:yes stop_codon:yes gene_type:complete